VRLSKTIFENKKYNSQKEKKCPLSQTQNSR
jgi:hypothetical protein